jgi:hypothetical protein
MRAGFAGVFSRGFGEADHGRQRAYLSIVRRPAIHRSLRSPDDTKMISTGDAAPQLSYLHLLRPRPRQDFIPGGGRMCCSSSKGCV